MHKLLVNAPSGRQELIEVGAGGGYFDQSRVLWDERVDGSLPNITLGGMVRNGGLLEFSQSRMDEHVAASTPSVADYTKAVQSHLDKAAQAKNYDDIVSACSYAGAPNPFQAEAQAFVTWRGDVWAKCYAIMSDVQNRLRTAPTIDGLISELPALVMS